MIHHLWRLSEGGDDNLGLAFTSEGLVLGCTPLIKRHNNRFVVRERGEIALLLGKAYQADIVVGRLMSGLAAVASALNANDQCLARIAAVHLRVPDLADQTARNSLEATDALIKSGDWDPALHPAPERRRTQDGLHPPEAKEAIRHPSELHKTTIQTGVLMPRPRRRTIGSGCPPVPGGSTNLPTL